MNLTEALNLISTYGVFCATSFKNINGATLTVQKNIISPTILINSGTNKIGYGYPYNFEYVLLGDDITLRNTTTWNGNVYYSNSLDKNSTFINKNFSNLLYNKIKINEISQQVVGYSNYLSTLETNTKSNKVSGSLTIKGLSSINVMNIDSSNINDLLNSTSIYLKVPKSSILIVNVSTQQQINLSNLIFDFGAISRNQVIFNFTQANVNIVGEFEPTILAPNSTVTLSNATTYGQLIVNNLIVSGIVNMFSSPFTMYSSLPKNKLPDNEITINYSTYSFEISNDVSDSKILYSLNGQEYIEYIGTVSLDIVGDIVVKTYSTKVGYYDSNITESNFTFSCECVKPVIGFSNNIITLTSETPDAVIHYTLDGTTPTVDSTLMANGGAFEIQYDGEYTVRAISYNGKCSTSGIVDKVVYVKHIKPELTINILNQADSEGNYYDDNGRGVKVEITCSIPNTVIYYSTDSSNPMDNGIPYRGPFYTYSNKICAVSYGVNVGYSNITETPLIVIGQQLYVERPEILINSENKADEFSEYSLYGQDVGWYGPTILVDDNAVYQSLVGILSTSLLEIPFRADFGTSLKSYIFQNTALMTSQEIISKLKGEIEFNDPRIFVDPVDSFAYFDADSNQIIINLSWRNNNTGEMATLKYGFNLDGIL